MKKSLPVDEENEPSPMPRSTPHTPQSAPESSQATARVRAGETPQPRVSETSAAVARIARPSLVVRSSRWTATITTTATMIAVSWPLLRTTPPMFMVLWVLAVYARTNGPWIASRPNCTMRLIAMVTIAIPNPLEPRRRNAPTTTWPSSSEITAPPAAPTAIATQMFELRPVRPYSAKIARREDRPEREVQHV